MPRDQLRLLAEDVARLLEAGAGGAIDRLHNRRKALQSLAEKVPALVPLAEAVGRAIAAPPPQQTAALLDLLVLVRQTVSQLSVPGGGGPLSPVAEAGPWASSTPTAEVLRVSAAWAPGGSAWGLKAPAAPGDLRLLGPLLKGFLHGSGSVADFAAEQALPAFGRAVVSEVEPLAWQGEARKALLHEARKVLLLARVDPPAALEAVRRLDPELAALAEPASSEAEPPWQTRLLAVAHLLRARGYRAAGDGRAGWEASEAALRLWPTFALAVWERGQADAMTTGWEKALADQAEAVRLDPRLADRPSGPYARAFWKRANRHNIHRRYHEALADCDVAIKLDPTYAEPYASRGAALRALGRHREALVALDRSIELDPKDAFARSQRSTAHRLLGNLDAALADANEAVRLGARPNQGLGQRGMAYRARGEKGGGAADYELALADFTEALRLAPNDPWLLGQRGVTLRLLGRHKEAVAELDRALKGEPRDHYWLQHRGLAYRLMGKWAQALADLDEALTVNPQSAWASQQRGMAYRDRGEAGGGRADFTLAVADFTRALELDPDDAWTLAQRALALRPLGKYDEAVADLTEALRRDPNMTWALFQRGETYRMKGDHDAAIADYTEVIRREPTDAGAWNGRGQSRMLKGDLDGALADLEESLRHKPDHAPAYRDRGDLYRRRGDYERALADLGEAIRLNPRDAWCFFDRARVYQDMGRYGKALADYRRALKISPEQHRSNNQIAWIQATAPRASARDGASAVEHARRACELADWKDADYLDTLAAAYAEAGNFRQAVRWQNRAVKLVDEARKAEFRSRVGLYKARQPYREQPLAKRGTTS